MLFVVRCLRVCTLLCVVCCLLFVMCGLLSSLRVVVCVLGCLSLFVVVCVLVMFLVCCVGVGCSILSIGG